MGRGGGGGMCKEHASGAVQHLVYKFGVARVLGVQILLRLVSAGLAALLAHHVEDLQETRTI